jgi:hypothetical protein
MGCSRKSINLMFDPQAYWTNFHWIWFWRPTLNLTWYSDFGSDVNPTLISIWKSLFSQKLQYWTFWRVRDIKCRTCSLCDVPHIDCLISNWVRALTVPMHLGLNGPFVPHKLIQVNVSHAPSMRFQMAPRLKLLMSSGSYKKKEPKYEWVEPKLHSHRIWAEDSSSVPRLIHKGLLVSPIKWICLLRVLCPVRRPVITLDCVLLIYFFLSFPQSPVREPPPCSLTVSTWTGILRHQSHWSIYSFVHSFVYVCRRPQKGALLHVRKNIRSPSTEPHAEGRPTYNGVRPGSPRGSLTTLLSLPQCHAALGATLMYDAPSLF